MEQPPSRYNHSMQNPARHPAIAIARAAAAAAAPAA
jgi:hypothetical protein